MIGSLRDISLGDPSPPKECRLRCILGFFLFRFPRGIFFFQSLLPKATAPKSFRFSLSINRQIFGRRCGLNTRAKSGNPKSGNPKSRASAASLKYRVQKCFSIHCLGPMALPITYSLNTTRPSKKALLLSMTYLTKALL